MSYPKKEATFMPLPAHSISEVYSSGMQFALASDKHEQACHFVFCKDFFQDAYQGFFNSKSRSIYQFKYDPKTDAPLSTKSLNLLVLNTKDAKFEEKMEGVEDFLNQIERLLKMKQKTRIYEVSTVPDWADKKKSKIFLIKTNKRWYAAPVMISLYTLLVRVGCVHTKGESYIRTINGVCSGTIATYQQYDRDYLVEGAIGLANILKYGDRKIFGRDVKVNFPPNVQVSTMHNNMGIVAYSKGTCQKRFPAWYEGFEIPKTNPFTAKMADLSGKTNFKFKF